MTHTEQVRQLRQWTDATMRRNYGAQLRGVKFIALMDASHIVVDALKRGGDLDRIERIIEHISAEKRELLIEGIDVMSLPTLSDMKAARQ